MDHYTITITLDRATPPMIDGEPVLNARPVWRAQFDMINGHSTAAIAGLGSTPANALYTLAVHILDNPGVLPG